MADRRTEAQKEFDLAKHGWAFCSNSMLKARLPRLRKIAEKLDPGDERHKTLLIIEGASEGVPL